MFSFICDDIGQNYTIIIIHNHKCIILSIKGQIRTLCTVWDSWLYFRRQQWLHVSPRCQIVYKSPTLFVVLVMLVTLLMMSRGCLDAGEVKSVVSLTQGVLLTWTNARRHIPMWCIVMPSVWFWHVYIFKHVSIEFSSGMQYSCPSVWLWWVS